MTPIRLGVLFAVLAVAMLVTELVWRPIFTVVFTEDFKVPLWILAAIYSAIQFTLWQLTKKKLELTTAELDRWGDVLERVTPRILNEYEAKTPVKDIAAKLEKSDGIPAHITLRYILALARHARALEKQES